MMTTRTHELAPHWHGQGIGPTATSRVVETQLAPLQVLRLLLTRVRFAMIRARKRYGSRENLPTASLMAIRGMLDDIDEAIAQKRQGDTNKPRSRGDKDPRRGLVSAAPREIQTTASEAGDSAPPEVEFLGGGRQDAEIADDNSSVVSNLTRNTGFEAGGDNTVRTGYDSSVDDMRLQSKSDTPGVPAGRRGSTFELQMGQRELSASDSSSDSASSVETVSSDDAISTGSSEGSSLSDEDQLFSTSKTAVQSKSNTAQPADQEDTAASKTAVARVDQHRRWSDSSGSEDEATPASHSAFSVSRKEEEHRSAQDSTNGTISSHHGASVSSEEYFLSDGYEEMGDQHYERDLDAAFSTCIVLFGWSCTQVCRRLHVHYVRWVFALGMMY